MTTEEMKKSSESPPPPTSFSSLPYDLALNILARISRIHRPTLFLVSKSFRSLVASRELDATRSLIGKNRGLPLYLLRPNSEPSLSLFYVMKLASMDKKGITFTCVNSISEAKNGLSTFALKFKDPTVVEEFRAVIEEHKESKPAVVEAADPLKTPENSPSAEDA